MGSPDDEHSTRLELRRPAVFAGMQLPDRRVEIQGEVRNPRGAAERPSCDNDVVSDDAVSSEPEQVLPIDGLHSVDSGEHAYRKLEPFGVCRQVVGYLVLGRIGPSRTRERQARQAVVPTRRVETERVPLGAPVVADVLVAIEDQAGTSPPLQVVRGRQTGLAGSDDGCLDVFDRHDYLQCDGGRRLTEAMRWRTANARRASVPMP